MHSELFEFAYAEAAEQYTVAQKALFSALAGKFPNADFDTVYRAGSRAMELYHSSEGIATKVHARTLPYEKALAALTEQYPEFPADVVAKALSNAFVRAR